MAGAIVLGVLTGCVSTCGMRCGFLNLRLAVKCAIEPWIMEVCGWCDRSFDLWHVEELAIDPRICGRVSSVL